MGLVRGLLGEQVNPAQGQSYGSMVHLMVPAGGRCTPAYLTLTSDL